MRRAGSFTVEGLNKNSNQLKYAMKHNLAYLSTRITTAIACVVLCTSSSVNAATWTNQSGGYWLDTNNWGNLDVPRGGGTSGEADFRGDWLTPGELVHCFCSNTP